MELYSRNFTFWHETWNRHEKYFVSLRVDLHRIICILWRATFDIWLSGYMIENIASAVKKLCVWFGFSFSLIAPISFRSTANWMRPDAFCGPVRGVCLNVENKSPRHSIHTSRPRANGGGICAVWFAGRWQMISHSIMFCVSLFRHTV